MIHILQTLQEQVSKEDIAMSDQLFKEFKDLESISIDEKVAELDGRLWEAYEASRRASILNQDTISTPNGFKKTKEAQETYSKALYEKQTTIAQHDKKVQKTHGELERLNNQVINFAVKLIDQELENNRARKMYPPRIVDSKDTMVDRGEKYDSWTKAVVYTVEHNHKVITQIGDILFAGRTKIRSMQNSTIAEIFGVVEQMEDEVNTLNPKTVERMEMSKEQYEAMKPDKTLVATQAEYQAINLNKKIDKLIDTMDVKKDINSIYGDLQKVASRK